MISMTVRVFLYFRNTSDRRKSRNKDKKRNGVPKWDIWTQSERDRDPDRERRYSEELRSTRLSSNPTGRMRVRDQGME